jgi:DNA-binding NtrC family response regulator
MKKLLTFHSHDEIELLLKQRGFGCKESGKHVVAYNAEQKVLLILPAKTGCQLGAKIVWEALQIAKIDLFVEAEAFGESSLKSIEAVLTQSHLSLTEKTERELIFKILKEEEGNKLSTCKRLGIGRQTLYNKIRKYGIDT